MFFLFFSGVTFIILIYKPCCTDFEHWAFKARRDVLQDQLLMYLRKSVFKIFDAAFAGEKSVLEVISVRSKLECRATVPIRAWVAESCIVRFLLLSSGTKIRLLCQPEN